MTQILLLKETIKTFIGRYEVYFKPLGKFLLAMIALLMINSATGYMGRIDDFSIVLVVALMCSFMPVNFIIVCAAGFLLLHFYSLSMECALVALVLFMILALLYFRFSPKDTLIILLVPMLFTMKLSYVLPICVGLLLGPTSAISVACGTVVYYVIHYITENAEVIGALEAESTSARFRYIIDGLLADKTMVVVAVAFIITVIVVYTVRRLPIDYCWTIAIVLGAIIQIVVVLLGNLMMDTTVSVGGAVLGSIIAIPIAMLVQFLEFHVDYTRTENVQFEDDDYYYYVKAVPKVVITKPDKTVKKINAQKKKKRAR